MTTLTADPALTAQQEAIRESGWGERYRFFQPHNFMFWVYLWLLVLGGTAMLSQMAGQFGGFRDAIVTGYVAFALFTVPFWLALNYLDRYRAVPGKVRVMAFLWGGLVGTFTLAQPANAAVLTLYAKLFGQPWAQDWGAGLTAPFTEALPLVSDAALAAAPTDEARRQLRLLRTTQEPAVAPVDLTATDGRRVFVSDARWTTAEVGWGKVCRNRYWFNPGQWEGLLLKLGNRAFAKGLYAHGKSRFVFPLGKRWKVFTGTVGLRDGAHPTGSAVFTVWGDGRELARSKVMHVGETAELIASTADVQELELRVEGGEGHTRNCWAIWADPVLTR